MKTKFLFLGLTLAICGITTAHQDPTLEDEKLELNIGTKNEKMYTLTAVDQNGREVGSVTYNAKDCNLPTPKTLRCFSGCDSLLTPKQKKKVKEALAKAAFLHALENGCAGKVFLAYDKATANLYKKSGAKKVPISGHGAGRYLAITTENNPQITIDTLLSL